MLNQELELNLNMAFTRAREYRHEFIIVEHLLLVLLSNPSAREVLKACSVDLVALHQEPEASIEQTTLILPASEGKCDAQPTLSFQRVLRRAVLHVQSSGHNKVTGVNVLVATFGEQESQAAYLLRKHEVSRLDVMDFIPHGIRKDEPTRSSDPGSQPNGEEQADGEERMENLTTGPNQFARVGGIDPLIGREKGLERVIQVLCRRRKDNPLLVGESGVGKTAIAEGPVWRIVQDNIPGVMVGCMTYSLDIGSLLTGAKYRGDFEKRFKALLKQLKQDTNSILFIDEIHIIIGAGAASGGQVDAASLIKLLLSNSKIHVIGSTIYQEFSDIFEEDRTLVRRLQKINITEPSVKGTVQIINGLKPKYEAHRDVRYTTKTVYTAIELAVKYINDRRLPDKAIDVIDEAGARVRLMPINKRRKIVNVADIESMVAHIARIPEKSVSQSDHNTLKNLDDRLEMLVFGQDKVIEALTEAIEMVRIGLDHEHKLVGSSLFAGPTGVGKVEVTIQLSKALGTELPRFDVSEHMERHTVSRLIGMPPRYVGLDQGGLLTDTVIRYPHMVLLLSETEKAYPDVFNIFLQVMDNGTLTDNNGRETDSRNVVLMMTINAGIRGTERKSVGLIHQGNSADAMEEIKKVSTSEFRDRLDNTIWFDHLSTDVIHQVVDKFIVELQVQLDRKGVSLEVGREIRNWLAEKGYDQVMDARPMAYVIQDNLRKPLVNRLLLGSLVDGGQVTVALDKEKNELTHGFQST